ncbi:MAG: hypothetical protein KDC24_08715 [Saprospiraceae bacterium]|nr:hypothetical protein [Saprospiraceae bacterium]
MNRFPIILFSIVVLLPFTDVFSQSWNTVGGIRLGTEWGLTARQRFLDHTTAEGIIQKGFLSDDVLITGLVEQHFPLASRRLNLYLGGGLHKGWFTDAKKREVYNNPFGISAIVGVEYTIGRLNLSYDFKPAIHLVGGERAVDFHTGLSVRYVLWKRKSQISQWFEDRRWEFWKKKDKKTKVTVLYSNGI